MKKSYPNLTAPKFVRKDEAAQGMPVMPGRPIAAPNAPMAKQAPRSAHATAVAVLMNKRQRDNGGMGEIS